MKIFSLQCNLPYTPVMRQQHYLLSLLPGFAPILIYIVVESLAGERAGLIAGMILGLGEFLFILVRERRIDAFTLVDTALLGLMGSLSLALSDPFFFRLKPAVSGGILGLMILAGSLGPHRLFLPYMEKKMGMGELPPVAVQRMTAMLAGFGALTLLHSALTAAAALWWSKTAWDFIAGALFWILALLYMVAWSLPVLFDRIRMKRILHSAQDAGEILPLVDEDGRVTGSLPRPLCHAGMSGGKPLHPVVRLWISDGEGGFWMQKRSLSKLVEPGKWDCAVGGHISFEETLEIALAREAREEIGLETLAGASFVNRFIWETPLERELVFLFVAHKGEQNFAVDGSEVSEIRLWRRRELQVALEKEETESPLTPLAVFELRTRLPGGEGRTEDVSATGTS